MRMSPDCPEGNYYPRRWDGLSFESPYVKSMLRIEIVWGNCLNHHYAFIP